MKIAAIQSSYIPWKGYFDIINDVDIFIFLDDVKYTKNSWRNRNQLKDRNGKFWITIPVSKRSTNKSINEVQPLNDLWQSKHWKTIQSVFGQAKYFSTYSDIFRDFYTNHTWDNLSELNQFLIKKISKDILTIDTIFKNSVEFNLHGEKTDRLICLLKQTNANIYISGLAARSYLEEEKFIKAGIKLIYKNHSRYPEYPQLYPPFEHHLSILDMLFNCGPDSLYYIWGFRSGKGK